MSSTPSIFQTRINSAERQKETIAQEVQDNSILATQEEQVIIDQIVDYASKKFASEIAMVGETPEMQAKIQECIREEVRKVNLPYEQQKRIEKIAIETTGLGPLEPLLRDASVSEIVVQRYDKLFVERKGRIETVSARFNSEKHLVNVINKIVQSKGRQLNLTTPLVDSRLDDGSRVNATLPPVTPDGATLTIRKFSEKKLTAEDYLRFESIDEKQLCFLEKCVTGKCNIFISGGTGTGKTTFLNMLSNYIPKNELILTIEDTCELQIQSDKVRRMETRPITSDRMMLVDTAACVKNALRMRPDRIIVGEIRDGAIVDLLSALSTGHDGGMATGHANSPENMINTRLPILYGMNKDIKVSPEAQQMQFSEAFDLVVQLKRFRDGKRRITEIAAVEGLNEKGYCNLVPVFLYDEKDKKFVTTGHIPERILDKCECNGVIINREQFIKNESENRKNQTFEPAHQTPSYETGGTVTPQVYQSPVIQPPCSAVYPPVNLQPTVNIAKTGQQQQALQENRNEMNYQAQQLADNVIKEMGNPDLEAFNNVLNTSHGQKTPEQQRERINNSKESIKMDIDGMEIKF